MATQLGGSAADVSVIVDVLGSLDSSMSNVQSTINCGWDLADEAFHKSTLIQLINHSMP